MSRQRQNPIGSYKTEWITIDEMDRDPIFQRPLDEKRAEEIGSKLNPDAFGTVTLSDRGTGRYVIIDGQHRIHALRTIGWNGQQIPCHVFSGLARAQEAKLFIELNNFKAIRFIDRFMSRLAAQDPVAVPIAKIVMDANWVIDRTARDGVITAAKALEDIYVGRGQKIKGVNPKAVRNTLDVVTAAWGRSKAAVNGQVLAGIGAFFLRYGSMVDTARLAEKLGRINGGPTGLVQRGTGKREIHGGTLASGIADFLVEDYNRGLGGRAKGRLPGWREAE